MKLLITLQRTLTHTHKNPKSFLLFQDGDDDDDDEDDMMMIIIIIMSSILFSRAARPQAY